MTQTQELLHRLWTKNVGLTGYDKTEWQKLEQLIIELDNIKQSAIEISQTCNFALKPQITDTDGMRIIYNFRHLLNK